MASKSDKFLIIIECLLVAYILLDIYASVFLGPNDVVALPVSLNATNEDPKIVGIGNFAVDEYSRLTKSNLKLVRIVKAMFVQSSYMILIHVTNGAISETKQYAAIVEVRGNGNKLVAFEKYNQDVKFE